MPAYDLLVRITVNAENPRDAVKIVEKSLPKPDQSEPPHTPVDSWEVLRYATFHTDHTQR